MENSIMKIVGPYYQRSPKMEKQSVISTIIYSKFQNIKYYFTDYNTKLILYQITPAGQGGPKSYCVDFHNFFKATLCKFENTHCADFKI